MSCHMTVMHALACFGNLMASLPCSQAGLLFCAASDTYQRTQACRDGAGRRCSNLSHFQRQVCPLALVVFLCSHTQDAEPELCLHGRFCWIGFARCSSRLASIIPRLGKHGRVEWVVCHAQAALACIPMDAHTDLSAGSLPGCGPPLWSSSPVVSPASWTPLWRWCLRYSSAQTFQSTRPHALLCKALTSFRIGQNAGA